jgi:hypothetical protein
MSSSVPELALTRPQRLDAQATRTSRNGTNRCFAC